MIIQCPGAEFSCLLEVRQGYGQYVELNYPVFEPRARFWARILGASGHGQVFSYAEWMVGFLVGLRRNVTNRRENGLKLWCLLMLLLFKL